MGRFKLSYRIDDLVVAEGACVRALPLAIGRTVRSTTVGAGDRFAPSCGGEGDPRGASDRVYRLTVDRRTGLIVTLEQPQGHATVSLRKICADGASEIRCASSGGDDGRAVVRATVEAGTYFVVVDGTGPFSLRADTETGARSPVPRR
jgi:hypothetical protein